VPFVPSWLRVNRDIQVLKKPVKIGAKPVEEIGMEDARMQNDTQYVAVAVRRMANGHLGCPVCSGELLLVEKGLLCVDGECDEVYPVVDGKPLFYINDTGKIPTDAAEQLAFH